MAQNDSLILYTNGEARALKLYDLNNDFYMSEENGLYRKSDDELICFFEESNFGYSVTNTTLLYEEVINAILEGDHYEVLPGQDGDGENPYNIDYWNNLYNSYFKIINPNNKKEYFISNICEVTFPTQAPYYWYAIPWNTRRVTNLKGINYLTIGGNTDSYSVGGWGKQDNHIGACALIYDYEGHANVIFVNKETTRNRLSVFMTNDLRMTETISSHSELFIDALSFQFADSDNFKYGTDATPGGYSGGSWDDSSDDIGIPNDPEFDFTTQGCGKLYKITSLANIMEEIFPNFEKPSGLDAVAEYLHNIFEVQNSEALKRYIVDAYAIPIIPNIGTSEAIQIGWKTLEQSAPPVTKQWVTFSCGTYSLKEYYSNFLDYEGTEVKLYLPFYGFVDINTEFIVSGTIEVVYKFDVVSGEFTVFIVSNSGKSQLNSVIAQYSGTAITRLPLNAVDHKSQVNGIISGASKVLGGGISIAQKDYGKGISEIAQGGVQMATSKPTASLSNSYSSSSAIMGIRTPFFLISREVGQFSNKYRSEVGLPLNVARKLSTISGFTVCQIDDIAIENATQEERAQVVALMRSGIIL